MKGRLSNSTIGEIRMAGHKLDVVVTMLLATQGDPGFDRFNLPVFVIERASNQSSKRNTLNWRDRARQIAVAMRRDRTKAPFNPR
jgi:hypothetical protein